MSPRKSDVMWCLHVKSRGFTMYFPTKEKAEEFISSVGEKMPLDWTLKETDMFNGTDLEALKREVNTWT